MMYHMPNPEVRAQMRLTQSEIDRLNGKKDVKGIVDGLRDQIKKHNQRITRKLRLTQRVENKGSVTFMSVVGEGRGRKTKAHKTLAEAEDVAIKYNKAKIRALQEQIKRMTEDY